MAIKKTELYSSLWASCDELRGGMDASQYKNYILTLLFMKYVTDKFADKDYPTLEIPEGGSFADMIALKGQKHIGDGMNTVLNKFGNANNMAWLANSDNDFNNPDKLGKDKKMVDTLTKLVSIFEDLDFGKNRVDGDDLLGDAYEYLMRHFATESGKSKGQFYTPAEVSRILAKILGINDNTAKSDTAYDPACGSGSLLLKVNEEAPNGLTLYGQEKEQATAALAKMNMVLHNSATAEIQQGDTLAEPHWKNQQGKLATYDFAVANPPFSLKAWSSGINVANDEFDRFDYGAPPEKNGDYAFLLHIIKSLKSTGKGAVILPHGVLFRGNAEAGIRRNLLRQGYIKGIIGLPANLFYGTSIPACIIVLDKSKSGHQNPVFMIDASKDFVKDGNKNRLRAQDIHRIVDVFTRQLEIERYSRLVPFAEIAGKNEYNLNIPRYIDSSKPEDIHDLSAHLSGGIPNRDIDALQPYWDVFPTLRTSLFAPGDREDYSRALVEARDVKTTILGHEEFKTFKHSALERFEAWKHNQKQTLSNIKTRDNPKELIFTIAEDLLGQFDGTDLLDNYDIYQILMSYWEEVMQDDVHLIVQEDWKVANAVRLLIPTKDSKGALKYKEEHHFEIGKSKPKKRYRSDIIPPQLVVAGFFAHNQTDIDALQATLDEAARKLESFVEENNGEDGLLDASKNDKGIVAEKEVKARKKQSEDEEEITALDHWLKLNNAVKASKKAHKAKVDALDKLVFDKIKVLSVEEIKQLTIFDKWFATIEAQIIEEIERVTQQLATRVKTLEERYKNTLPDLAKDVDIYSARVDEHLRKMGLAW
ncbi:MAG: type I restriction-modification system subunit M [Hyphomicrobiales bacterium]|nr:MAG: type I restriction-modification system subunit M [Hyphomicrobiales bacterium]